MEGVWVVSGYYDGARSEEFRRLSDAFQPPYPSPPKPRQPAPPDPPTLTELLEVYRNAYGLMLSEGEIAELGSMIRARVFERPEEVTGEVIEDDE